VASSPILTEAINPMAIENPVGKIKQKAMTTSVICQVIAPDRTKFISEKQKFGKQANINKGHEKVVTVIDPKIADPRRAQEFLVGFI
jgi:hypothetical protein